MHVEEFRLYCLSKPGVTESFPFDVSTLVFKVENKIFALAGIDNFGRINLKCDPEWAIELREKYAAILPGYHMNKTHWNTVVLNGDADDTLVYQMIDHSYHQIIKGLPKSKRLLYPLLS